MSWNTLPLDLSGRVVEAATRTSLIALPAQSAPTAAANGKIAFVSFVPGPGGNAEIYTINADGSERRRLTLDPAQDADPAWSPDGTKIAFVRHSGPNNHGEIFVMNADGSDQRRLTLVNQHRNDRSPTWSPDGTKIAFSNQIYPGANLYIMNADGSEQRAIQGGIYYPAWSPDGLKMAGSSWNNGIILFSLDSSSLTQITQPPEPFDLATYFVDYEPAWSPDGSKIVFSRADDCDVADCYSSRLYVVDSDGSNPTVLTPQANLGDSPAWSPDGRKIVFGGYSSGDLYVINPDGSGLTNLTNTNDQFEHSPSWQPLAPAACPNPIDCSEFFVRQQYLDFLGREPDPQGLAGWLNILNNCGVTVPEPCDRIEVSSAFFRSPEFQGRGYFIYRFYPTIGKVPIQSEFMPDFARVSGFLSDQQLEANKAAFVLEFMARPEFQNRYASTFSNPTAYVDALLQTVGLPNHSARQTWINQLNANNTTQTRGDVLRALVESTEMDQRYFNESFVVMQYFGYLRRTADAQYLQWIQTMNQNGGDYRIMINGFLNSPEYRQRFGP